MAGLVPAIHAFLQSKAWMPGTRPGMTNEMPRESTMLKRRIVLAAAALIAFAGTASAQNAVDVAKAKSEGKVVWYTSTPLP